MIISLLTTVKMSRTPQESEDPSTSSNAWESYALSLAQLHDYGCMIHPPGECPSEPVFLQALQPFDQDNPDPSYCVPAIPAPADQIWQSSPSYRPDAEQLSYDAAERAAEEAAMQELAYAVDAEGASAAPITQDEPHSPDYPPPDLLQELRERGCDFGAAPWEPGSPHYGPPGSCKNHPYGTCPSQNPYSYYVDRRRRLGLPYSYACAMKRLCSPSPDAKCDRVIRNRRSQTLKKRYLPKQKLKTFAKHSRRRENLGSNRVSPSGRLGLLDLGPLATALEESTTVPVSVTDLESLLSQVSIGRRDRRPRRQLTKRTKGTRHKKKGGNRTKARR